MPVAREADLPQARLLGYVANGSWRVVWPDTIAVRVVGLHDDERADDEQRDGDERGDDHLVAVEGSGGGAAAALGACVGRGVGRGVHAVAVVVYFARRERNARGRVCARLWHETGVSQCGHTGWG